MSRARKTALLTLMTFASLALAAPPAFAADGATVYKKVCSFCHDDGTVGAPMPGDMAAWKTRLAKGMEAVYANVLNGKGHMPPRMNRRGYNEVEIRAAVDYLLEAVKDPGAAEFRKYP